MTDLTPHERAVVAAAKKYAAVIREKIRKGHWAPEDKGSAEDAFLRAVDALRDRQRKGRRRG